MSKLQGWIIIVILLLIGGTIYAGLIAPKRTNGTSERVYCLADKIMRDIPKIYDSEDDEAFKLVFDKAIEDCINKYPVK